MPLTVNNPCISSIVDPEGALGIPSLIEVPMYKTYYKNTYYGPSDSISLKYDRVDELCGNYKYKILDPVTKEEFYSKVFKYEHE